MNLFDVLNKAYGTENAWLEVESAMKEEDMPFDLNDFHDPFKNLVIGVLSQNTSDRISTKAYTGLVNRFNITPHELARADEKEIREAIKPGGLYNVKAKRIKNLADAILEKHGGDLSKILELPRKDALRNLLELPGIGRKTADVCLAYCARRHIIPVDTNIDRVAKRLGIAPLKATYEDVQESLELIIPPADRVRGHELLIRLGRDYCKARKPLCNICPVVAICMHVKQ